MSQIAGAPPRLRSLILAHVAVSLLGAAVAVSDTRLLPPALREYRAALTEQPISIAAGIVMLAYLICGVLLIVGWVGLWRGSRFGARAYLASWLLLTVTAFFGHPTVASAPSSALAMLSSLVGGAILGITFSADTSSTQETGNR